MGCLKLTYSKEKTTLKVAYSSYKKSSENRAECYRYGFNGKENDNEVKGAGNSVDFGARGYDPRLGRWLGMDPEFKQYAFASPYMAFGNNPFVFIDPSGETLRVAKDVNKEETRALLQRLTNDKVVIQKDGIVRLIAGNQNPDKKLVNGTQLLRDLAGHKRNIEIFKIDMAGENNAAVANGTGMDSPEQYNGIGADSYVFLGKTSVKLEYDNKTKKTVRGSGNKAITLSGELIHALKIADGAIRKDEWIEESTYRDEKGVLQSEIQPREELETHGIGDFKNIKKNGKAYVNENDIRKEQGLNKRVAYNEETNRRTDGTTYPSTKNKK